MFCHIALHLARLLRDNPWVCDCRLRQLIAHYARRQDQVLDRIFAICSKPSSVANQPLLLTNPDSMECCKLKLAHDCLQHECRQKIWCIVLFLGPMIILGGVWVNLIGSMFSRKIINAMSILLLELDRAIIFLKVCNIVIICNVILR